MSRLRTPICDLFGIEVPIVLAGMGGASAPELAAAVSNAGGLGILGAAGCGPDELREWIARTRKLTEKPFGVDTLLPASVRRGAFNKPAATGKSPEELLPEYLEFARDFMEREGLKRVEQQRLRGGFTNDFFEAQMKVVIAPRTSSRRTARRYRRCSTVSPILWS